MSFIVCQGLRSSLFRVAYLVNMKFYAEISAVSVACLLIILVFSVILTFASVVKLEADHPKMQLFTRCHPNISREKLRAVEPIQYIK